MEAYQHERLDQPADGSGSIRLVKIKRGNPGDEVQVVIQQFSLVDAIGPRASAWHALSYTWGDLADTENVLVDTEDELGNSMWSLVQPKSLTVTRHLTEFLRTVRHRERDRIMWIDAICIDQAGDAAALEEKASQIGLMYQIYNKASGVILWLGPEADDSTYALQLLDELGSSFIVNWITFEVSTLTGEYSDPMKRWAYQYGRTTRELQAVWALLGRKYFTRTWIRQEATLANDEASIVKCGSQEMQLAKFRRAIHFLGSVGYEAVPTHTPAGVDNRLSKALSICQRTYMDEPNIMIRTRLSDCKDLRDKVYGSLGLMRIMGDTRFVSSIVVDASPDNTMEKVYQDFFRRYYERYHTLRLLNEAGLCSGSGLVPSWVPDWSKPTAGLDLSMEAATSHFARAECTFIGGETLQVLGRRGSEVCAVHYQQIDNAHQPSMDWYWELLSILRSLNRPDLLPILIEQMSYAICCAMYTLPQTIEVVLSHRPGIAAYLQYLCSKSASSSSDIKKPIDMIGHAAAWALGQALSFLKLSQLPIILCNHGLLGIGCRTVREGDTVTALLGSRALMLLRPSHSGNFQVVGPCFVHGLNWGEALLGPLPKDHIITPQLKPGRTNYMPYYKDMETGVATIWDPRIVWSELEADSQMADFDIMFAPDGGTPRARPDSEYLQRHGISIERFKLV